MFEERQRSCACVGDRVKHCQYCGNTGEEYLRHARGESHPWHGGRLAAAFLSAGGCWDPRRLARVAGLRLRLACRCPLFVAVPLCSALQPASVSSRYEYDCGPRTDRGGSGVASATDTAGWAVVVGRVDPQGGLGPVVAVELLFRRGPPPPTPLCPAAPLSTPVPPPPFERPDSGPAPFPVGRRRARAGTESAQGLGLVPSALRAPTCAREGGVASIAGGRSSPPREVGEEVAGGHLPGEVLAGLELRRKAAMGGNGGTESPRRGGWLAPR